MSIWLSKLLRWVAAQFTFKSSHVAIGQEKVADCGCEPIIIPDSECIIRAVYYHVHCNSSGTLKWQAYEPTPGTDEISVMRGGCMTPNSCKRKAKELDKLPSKIYRGLAVLSSGAVRKNGMAVSDSRSEYCGHAHISTGVKSTITTDSEPRDPVEREQIKVIAKELIKLSNYLQDTQPASDDWPQSVVLIPPPV